MAIVDSAWRCKRWRAAHSERPAIGWRSDPSRPPLACRPSPPRGGDWLSSRLSPILNANHGEGAYEKLAKRADGTTRFYDAPLRLKVEDRYTYNYRGQLDLLDHLMVDSAKADAITGVKILHINPTKDAKKSQWDPKVLPGYSDHDSMVVDFDSKKLLGA